MYMEPSPRERDSEKAIRIDQRKKSKEPHPAPAANTAGPCPTKTLAKIAGRTGAG